MAEAARELRVALEKIDHTARLAILHHRPRTFVSDDCARAVGTAYPPYEPPNTVPLKKPNPDQAQADAAHFYRVKEEPPAAG